MPRLHSAHTGPPSARHSTSTALANFAAALRAPDVSTITGAQNLRQHLRPLSVGATRAGQATVVA